MTRWAARKVRRKLQSLRVSLQPSRYRLFSHAEAEFITEGYKTMTLPDLTEAFNARFPRKSLNQIRAFTRNHGITSGRTGCFEKGQTPWNLGKKGYMGANATSFKAGNLPHNKRRLWSERIGKDGFIEISVPEKNPRTGHPTRFKHKHVWLWECENGPVPKRHAVAFKDGNNQNCVIENLMLVTRAELLAMNLHGYKNMPEELKPSVLALAKLEAKAGIRVRPARGRAK